MVRTTRARWLLILAAALAVHAAVIVHRRQSHGGDFDISRELGRRLLAHEELYAGGLHYPYLPAAALAFAPLALLPAAVGFVLRYLLALASLALTLHWLYLLVRRWDPHVAAHRWRVATATVVLALPYVVRDLDDSGPHLILLALVVAGLTCAARGRDALAAASIGLATAVKATHGLLIPFFLLNRQRRLAGWTAAATVLWMLAPLPWMGTASWYRHHVQWAQTALASVRLAPNLRVAVESEERVQNQSLAAATRRWAERGLDRDAARTLGAVAMLALLMALAWGTRGTQPGDARWLPHASAVLIGAALLSPATWVQHLVLVIPALYVIVARRCSETGTPSRIIDVGLLAYIVLALVLNRELLGRERYLILLAGGIHTAAMLIILTLVMVLQRVSSPFEKGGVRGICSSDQSQKIPLAPFSKGGTFGAWLPWIIGLGVLARVRQYVANTSLWHDESFVALNVLNTPFTALLGPLDWHEPSPPGFLAAQQLVVALLGQSEYALRLLPLTAGVAALCVFVVFARRVCRDDTAVLWAVAFMACSPKLIEQCNQVKHFTLDVLATVALLTLAWQARETMARHALMAWTAVAALAPWFSYASVFMVAVTGVMLAVPPLTSPPPSGGDQEGAASPPPSGGDREGARRTLFFGSLIVLLSLLVLIIPVQQQRTGAVLAFWSGAFPNAAHPAQAFAWAARSVFAFLGHYWQPMGAVIAGCVLLACAAAWAERRRALLALCWLPVLLTIAAAFLHLWPFGGNQHTAFLAPIVLLFAAQGAEIVRSGMAPWRPRLATAFMLLLLAPGVAGALYHLIVPRYRHELRPVIQFMQARATPQDAVMVFDPATFAYYTGRDVRGEMVDTASAARVWVITPRASSGSLEPEVEGQLSALRQRRTQIDEIKVRGAAAYLFGPADLDR